MHVRRRNRQLFCMVWSCSRVGARAQAEKLRAALAVHLPADVPAADAAAFLDALMAHLAASWHLELTPAALGREGVEPAQVVQAARAPDAEADAAAASGAGGLATAAADAAEGGAGEAE